MARQVATGISVALKKVIEISLSSRSIQLEGAMIGFQVTTVPTEHCLNDILLPPTIAYMSRTPSPAHSTCKSLWNDSS